MAFESAYTQQTKTWLKNIRPVFEVLAEKYRSRWGLECTLTDLDGRRIAGPDVRCSECSDDVSCIFFRKRAVLEALNWGEPSMVLCPDGNVIWGVPVMLNSEPVGGIVTGGTSVASHDEEGAGLPPSAVHHAASDLLSMATEANLTNIAYLNLNKSKTHQESKRAEAIHELKAQTYQSIRDIYLRDEPALIAAIKRGDRHTARGILNRVLAGIYFFGRKRPELLKSFILELVVTMSRSAVEAGADPSELLGSNYSAFSDLSGIETEEDLCAWLVSMLERIMDAITQNRKYPSSVLLGSALHFMEEHFHENVSRDDVADIACLSPSHFSRIIKQTFGHSFTELLSGMRVEKACELLIHTEKSLSQICFECGFGDQSYFTKVFKKRTGQTPAEYRRVRTASLR